MQHERAHDVRAMRPLVASGGEFRRMRRQPLYLI